MQHCKTKLPRDEAGRRMGQSISEGNDVRQQGLRTGTGIRPKGMKRDHSYWTALLTTQGRKASVESFLRE
eukprot:12154559-Ditylum_brightwellii.AAC.1